jgi:thiol peroxidase
MEKRTNEVTFKGGPVTLAGPRIKPGDAAPDFKALTGDLAVVGLKETGGKARIYSVVPSLDTPVCNVQTKKFESAIAGMGDQVAYYTVSLDLPFAQKRFCGAENVQCGRMLSDVHDGSFGRNWGTRIESLPLPLLARSVFVVDKNGKVTYVEYVKEVTSEPDYDAALAALKKAAA